jgi:fermentation-respiration switch protein FrsA (DUF1100 family)
MIAALLSSLLFLPAREILATPAQAGLAFEEVAIEPADGGQLHGWWVPTRAGSPVAHVLLCHGNAGNVGDRVVRAALLCTAGLDVLLFDYRGYGRSTGRPSELGTYRDARAVGAAGAPGGEPRSCHLPRRVDWWRSRSRSSTRRRA